jgi:hypothetical protein
MMFVDRDGGSVVAEACGSGEEFSSGIAPLPMATGWDAGGRGAPSGVAAPPESPGRGADSPFDPAGPGLAGGADGA